MRRHLVVTHPTSICKMTMRIFLDRSVQRVTNCEDECNKLCKCVAPFSYRSITCPKPTVCLLMSDLSGQLSEMGRAPSSVQRSRMANNFRSSLRAWSGPTNPQFLAVVTKPVVRRHLDHKHRATIVEQSYREFSHLTLGKNPSVLITFCWSTKWNQLSCVLKPRLILKKLELNAEPMDITQNCCRLESVLVSASN